MAHFAQLDENNIVSQVIVVNNEDILDDSGNESEEIGRKFCADLLGGNWIQTSYNASARNKYAAIGDTYDLEKDAFIEPQPHPSWILDALVWVAPKPIPADGKEYYWDEPSLQWVEIPAL